jgi:hypothetical protein
MFIFDFFKNLHVKRMEKKIKKYKPMIITTWYAKQEEAIKKAYEEEYILLQDKYFALERDYKELIKSRDYYKGKYEGVVETQVVVREQLLGKVEDANKQKGKLEAEVKHLKSDIKEKLTK